MFRSMTPWIVCTLFMTAGGARAEPVNASTSPEPALIVQAKSINGLLADLKYVAQLVERGDQVDQLDGLIAAFAGPNGLAGTGLDAERPFLAYVVAAPGGLDSPFAIMVPVSDEQTLLTVLANFSINPTKDSHDIYTLSTPAQASAIHFKFANKYVYVTAMDKANLADAKIIAPEKIINSDPNLLLGVTLRLDRVPDQLKQLALGQVELKLADIKDRDFPDETRDQKRMRVGGIDALNYVIRTIVSEGKSVDLQTSLDRAKDDVKVSLSLDGKESTMLSQAIAFVGEGKSTLAVADSAALHLGLNLRVPAAYRPFLDMALRDQVARQTDPGKKEMMAQLCTVLSPTLQRGELDTHMAWMSHGVNGPFSAVAGVAVAGGEKIEAVAKNAVQQMPVAEQKRIKVDAAKAGDMQLHQVILDGANMDQRAGQIFGVSPPNMWTGFGPQAVMIGLGLDATRTFGALHAVAEAKPSPAILVEASVARLAPLDEAHPGAAKLAQSVFSQGPSGSDAIRLSLDGGKSLKFSASFKGRILRFLYLLNERPSDL